MSDADSFAGAAETAAPVVRLPAEASMEDLLDDVASAAQRRMTELLAANQSIVSELSLPLVLRRIVEAAAKVAGARYAALGVLGPDGLLEQFVHRGMEESVVGEIEHLPRGRGVLGAVIAHPDPIRLDAIADDPGRRASLPVIRR